MKYYLSENDIKFIPLYDANKLLKFDSNNSYFKIYTEYIKLYSNYPLSLVESFSLKTKGKNYLLQVVDAKQCGQNEFEATLQLEKNDNCLKELVLKSLKDFH